ncbi:MAG TPA: phage tail protein [Pyrinomonadaceae bacterium]|nr:phage tail protein [Pyrinomonadaceae bacterium]
MATRRDPIRNFRFRVEIDGVQQAGFSEVSGFDITVDPIDYREGTDPTHVRKLTGMTKYGNVTLKWGITTSMELYNWHRQIVDGDIVRKTMAIVSVNERGDDVNRWEIVEAWPTKYDPMDFNAKGNEAGIATLEVTCEGITQVS